MPSDVRAPRLLPGDRVAVIAPSGPADLELLDAGLDVVRSWGLRVAEGRHLRGHRGYLSASDRDRARDLEWALTDASVAAVLCARGGYGAQRIADLVDWSAVGHATPRVLVGLSDVTALHAALWVRCGRAGLYGPGVAGEAIGSQRAADHLRRSLMEPASVLTLELENASALVEGVAHGVLLGGCLSLVASAIGTADAGSGRRGIVVLEDVGEPAYRLDRYLTQLLRAGWFDGVAAVVLGTFTRCAPEHVLQELMRDRLGPLDVPILWGADIGHSATTRTLPLGVPAALDTLAATIVLDEPALR